MLVNNLNKAISILFFTGIIFFLQSNKAFSQKQQTFVDEKTFEQGERMFVKNWKYHTGDLKAWAEPGFDDSNWDTISPDLDLNNVSEKILEKIIWFRLHLLIDSSLVNVPLKLTIFHRGASQLFLNGKNFLNFGVPSAIPDQQIPFNSRHASHIIVFPKSGENIIAIRYSNLSSPFYYKLLNISGAGFDLNLDLLNNTQPNAKAESKLFSFGILCVFGFLLALSLLHGLIYLFYREQRSNLYYTLFTACFACFFILISITGNSSLPSLIIWCNFLIWRFLIFTFIALLWLVFSIIYDKVPRNTKRITNIISVVVIIISLFSDYFKLPILYGLISVTLTCVCTTTGILVSRANKRKQEGVKIIGRGFQVFIYFALLYFIVSKFFGLSFEPNSGMEIFVFTLFCIGILSVPISMSAYLAFNFSKTNKDLKLKLIEVETLSAITLEQERARKKMIESQKEDLEIQVKLRTAEIENQKAIIEEQKKLVDEKQKEIIDSIKYAWRIQNALITSERYIHKALQRLLK